MSIEREQAVRNFRAGLLQKGYTMRSFARRHGHNVITVIGIVQRFVGTGQRPRAGSKSERILLQLEEIVAGAESEKPPQDADLEGAL